MSVKWTKARTKRYQRTMKAKRLAKANGGGPRLHAAIALLEQAQNDSIARLRSGALKRLDHSHLLSALALDTLRRSLTK